MAKLALADWFDEHERPVEAACWRRFVDFDLVPWFMDDKAPRNHRHYGVNSYHWYPLDTDVCVPVRARLVSRFGGPFMTIDVAAGNNHPLNPHPTPVRAYLSLVNRLLVCGYTADRVREYVFK